MAYIKCGLLTHYLKTNETDLELFSTVESAFRSWLTGAMNMKCKEINANEGGYCQAEKTK